MPMTGDVAPGTPTGADPTTGSRSWLDRATQYLADAGVPSPHNDAVLLAVDGVGHSRLALSSIDDPGPRYWSLLVRRARREPLQHIVGWAWFRHIVVAVGPGVFVPRPETEVVAGAAVAEAHAVEARGRAPVVVDLGTGSGVIALSVRHEVPTARVHAVELDDAAHRWAQRNLVGSGIALHHADLSQAPAVLAELAGRVDVVVSNPPDIPPDGVPVDPEVRDHDPAPALYGSGADGLGDVRAVVVAAHRLLTEGGLVVVEHADTQGEAVLGLLDGDWVDPLGHLDLSGRARYVTARRGPRPR
jgi:release factor glutamine methyltransferase